MNEMIHTGCALCSQSLKFDYKIEEEGTAFCCKGCQVVYRILEAQNALENFHQHPVFRQAMQAGLITNPNFETPKEEERGLPEEDFHKIYFLIEEMWCPSCAQVIHLILLREKGIKHCVVDYSTDLASIEYTPRFITKEKIVNIIAQLGYIPRQFQDPRQVAISRSLLMRFIVAAFFSLNIMMFAYPIYASYWEQQTDGYADLFAWLSFWGALPVLFYSAYPIWRRFFTGLKVGIWGMEALVCMGVGAATALSIYELSQGSPNVYFDSMSVIIVFVLLGKIIESKAKFSAKDALFKLSLSLPRKGRKLTALGEECFVSIKDFNPGDYLIVNMGEKIVLDGVVAEGAGTCDESVMTGEVIPISKKPGESVLAGSYLQQGHLLVKVTASWEETALHKIMEMVTQEIGQKTQYIRAADKIVKIFVPVVLFLALLTGGYCVIYGVADGQQTVLQTAVIRMVSVLLISCPCAIGIAAPLVESYTLNHLAKIGIIVRNRACLAFLGRESVFVFDKTGTVTEGRFELCQGLESLSELDKQILKAITSYSIHPISFAINQAINSILVPLEYAEEIIGKGIWGKYNEECYYLGSKSFLQQKGIDVPENLLIDSSRILTTVYFAKGNSCLATLFLGDRLKPGIVEFVHSLGSVKTLLVSGDGEMPVERVAKTCGINEWHFGYHPLQKRALIDSLKKKGEIVAMLGDGLNDAPALTAANVGIAVVSASDMSIQVSDLLLTVGNFNALTHLQKIAKKSHRLIKQNLFWAFFYNCVGIGLAMTGLLSPLFAAFAMVISSLMVLFNAHRVSRQIT